MEWMSCEIGKRSEAVTYLRQSYDTRRSREDEDKSA